MRTFSSIRPRLIFFPVVVSRSARRHLLRLQMKTKTSDTWTDWTDLDTALSCLMERERERDVKRRAEDRKVQQYIVR